MTFRLCGLDPASLAIGLAVFSAGVGVTAAVALNKRKTAAPTPPFARAHPCDVCCLMNRSRLRSSRKGGAPAAGTHVGLPRSRGDSVRDRPSTLWTMPLRKMTRGPPRRLLRGGRRKEQILTHPSIPGDQDGAEGCEGISSVLDRRRRGPPGGRRPDARCLRFVRE